MATTFDRPRNLVATTLAAPRADGATEFALAAGAGALVGDEFPLLFTATPADNLDGAGRPMASPIQ